MLNGGSFEGVDGYMNFQGFMQQLPGEGSLTQSLHAAMSLQDQQQSPPNLAAAANNSGATAAAGPAGAPPSRYESQKRRDWNTFGQYLRNHRPPLDLAKCSGAHVLEFLRYLDQFGKTKVHTQGCPFFGHPQPPAACACPLRQAWGSLDALIGRLRAAFEENGGKPESNPFGARAVRLHLRDVRESQAKARGIAYEKKKRKRPSPTATAPSETDPPAAPPPPPPHHHHHHHHQHQHQAASISTSSSTSGPHNSSSLLPSHAESLYSSSSSANSHMGVNHLHDINTGAGGLLHESSLGISPDHSYHHHQQLQPQAPARPSPAPLIPSFN